MCCCPGRVEWEFWTSSNDGCGNGCDRQAEFKQQMRETAQTLEKVTHPPYIANSGFTSGSGVDREGSGV